MTTRILTPGAADKPLLTDNDAASLCCVTSRTIRLWRRNRGLPFLRPTKRVVLIKRADLMAWLERSRVATV